MKTARGLFFFLAVIFVFPSGGLAGESEETGYIAVVAAYQGELDAIRAMVEDEVITEERTINGVTFSLGAAYGKPVIFFRTNVSMVNAAMTTQLALSNFNIRALVFSGIAGGINRELQKGDVAIPAKWHETAQGSYFNEDTENPGEYVMADYERKNYTLGNFEMFHPRGTRVAREGSDELEYKVFFEADPGLLKVAEKAARQLDLINAHGGKARVKIGGVGAAGPVFMDNAEYREFIYRTWKSDTVDMESTAIAHVCWANRVPFVIARGLSDLAGGQAGINEADEFGDHAEDNAARMLNEILRLMD